MLTYYQNLRRLPAAFYRPLAFIALSLVSTCAARHVARAQRHAAPPAAHRFSHPTRITNLYLPLSDLHQDILEGREGAHAVRVERTRKAGVKTFTVWGQKVAAMTVEDKEFSDGKVSEITRDYFAQADDGTVYYLGEDVDNYRNGKVVAHEGAWLTGVRGAVPGVLIPGHLAVGARFKSEDVPKVTQEKDEIVSLSATATSPAGNYKNCLKIKETLSEGEVEYKIYAPHVGVVIEAPEHGELRLISHR